MLKAYEPTGSILFEEKQKFPNWLYVMVVAIIVFTIALTLIAGLTTAKGKNESWISLAISVPLELFIVYLFQQLQLEKVVTSNGLYFRWKSWQKKFRIIDKEELEAIEVRRFPFLSYGFGWLPGYGRYHNASRGEGIQLYLKNGRRFFFSTADKTAFVAALQNLIFSNSKRSTSER